MDVGTCPNSKPSFDRIGKKGPKSKFNFVPIPNLELTYFTSAEVMSKKKSVENVENHFKKISELNVWKTDLNKMPMGQKFTYIFSFALLPKVMSTIF